MTATFPAHLYKGFARGSLNEQSRPHFSEWETDSGATVRSKRPGSARVPMSFQRVYRMDEWEHLKAFYQTACNEGVTSFYMAHPLTRLQGVYQWAQPPSVQHIAGDRVTVQFSLIRE